MSNILGPGFNTSLYVQKCRKILLLVHILILLLVVSLKINEVIQCILCFCNSLSIKQVHTLINLPAKGSLGPCLKGQDQSYFNLPFKKTRCKSNFLLINRNSELKVGEQLCIKLMIISNICREKFQIQSLKFCTCSCSNIVHHFCNNSL